MENQIWHRSPDHGHWIALLAAVAVLASLFFVTSPAAAQEVDEPAESTEFTANLQAFAVRDTDSCRSKFNVYVRGEDTDFTQEEIDVAPPIVGDNATVTYCVILTNSGDELVTDFTVLNSADLNFEPVSTDEATSPRPGRSQLFAATALVNLETPPLTVVVTSFDPARPFTVAKQIELDQRRVPASVGTYTVEVGQTIDVVLSIDATEFSGSFLEGILEFDPDVIQPVVDEATSRPQCSALAADGAECQLYDPGALFFRVAWLTTPEVWDGPELLVSIPFTTVAPGASSLELSTLSLGESGTGFFTPLIIPVAINGWVDTRPLYVDLDGDTFGDANAEPVSVFDLDDYEDGDGGYARNNTDCNDADPAVSPAAFEVLGNGVDENCDGSLTEPTIVMGDVSCDGQVDLVDAILIIRNVVRTVVGVEACPVALPGEMLLPAADTNGDGIVTMIDAITITQCLVGLSNNLCPDPAVVEN